MSLELDLTPIVDQLVERIVNEVTDRLAERLFGPAAVPEAVEPEPEPVQPPTPKPATTEARAPKSPAPQDATTRTCQICGRVGQRRFVPAERQDDSDTGWRCSPTAYACVGNRPAPVAKVPNPALAKNLDTAPPSDIPANTFSPNVTPGVTARCQDCTRTWTLGGRVLDMAVNSHELKHAHIVTVYNETEQSA